MTENEIEEILRNELNKGNITPYRLLEKSVNIARDLDSSKQYTTLRDHDIINIIVNALTREKGGDVNE